MKNIEDYLHKNSLIYPDKVAVVCNGMKWTYAQLWQQVENRAKELTKNGLLAGRPQIIRASQSTDFLVTYFAIHLVGAVAVPLEASLPDEPYREIENVVTASDIPAGSADILFTTGTTGKSKGVIISHGTIMANAENLLEAQGYSHDLTFVINGPLNHIGSLSKIYPILLVGGTLHILEGMKDINAFFAVLNESCSKFATFLVPSSIRMLLMLSGKELQKCSDKFDFIETGAAPIAQSDMEQLCKLLPNTRLYNTYASTETGIICTHNFNSDKCIAGCLGKPMKHSSIFITEHGTVACQGKTLMTGYVGEPELTASILRNGTIFTHDNGMIDSDGMLHLTGRADDVINVGGFKVSPVEIEDVVMALPEVADCVCVAVSHPVMGMVLKLLVVLNAGEVLEKKKIAQYIHSKLEAYKVPSIYEEVGSIQRTYNGKINRKFYRKY